LNQGSSLLDLIGNEIWVEKEELLFIFDFLELGFEIAIDRSGVFFKEARVFSPLKHLLPLAFSSSELVGCLGC